MDSPGKYIIVDKKDQKYIEIIYNILKKCGINMALKGLFHWIPPYSRRSIRNDCNNNIVVLVWDEGLKDYSSTFQMKIDSNSCLVLRKIATLPRYEGKGIGKENLQYVDQYAREKGCKKISLEVYIKNRKVVDFYLRNGYKTVGLKRSIRFKELMMEKGL